MTPPRDLQLAEGPSCFRAGIGRPADKRASHVLPRNILGTAWEAEMSDSALTNLTPQVGLIGPTVEDDIHRAITRYGAEAVKGAITKLTKPKTGRPLEKDWLKMKPMIEADAKYWLAGGDPFAERTNYSIAKEVADSEPGHSHDATIRRLTRKLKEKRQLMTYLAAMIESEKRSYLDYIRALEAAVEIGGDESPYTLILQLARSAINDYELTYGNPPSPELTLDQVKEKPKNALISLSRMSEQSQLGGLFGRYVKSQT